VGGVGDATTATGGVSMGPTVGSTSTTCGGVPPTAGEASAMGMDVNVGAVVTVAGATPGVLVGSGV
jgi:hypothetical protein